MRSGPLPDEAKTLIVQHLACFDSPAVVAEAVKKELGIAVSRQAVESYNPTRRAGAKLAEKWKALFSETRKAFLEDTAEIGIAHRSVRLRRLDRMQLKAESMGNLQLAGELGEKAAKEQGDAYTNTRVIRGGLELTAPKGLADFYAGADGRLEGER